MVFCCLLFGEMQFTVAKEAWWQGQGAVGHIESSVRKQRVDKKWV